MSDSPEESMTAMNRPRRAYVGTGIGVLVCIMLALYAVRRLNFVDNTKSVDKQSAQLPDDPSKIAFLRQYLKMFSEIEATEFHIVYQDNSGGMVPGPSDFDIQVVMKMSPDKTPLWTAGFTRINEPVDLDWGNRLLPRDKKWKAESKPAIYKREHAIVAVFEPEGIVFKRVSSLN